MVDFNSLKKNRSSSLDKLNKKLEEISPNRSGGADTRFWSPTTDEVGNGYAVIRFLPAPGEEDDPFIRIFDHGFQGPGGWYIENSLTTIGQPDPLAEYNSELWNSGIEANKDIARKQKRRLHFISNIYVVKDSAKPENEGKVFLYKYGKRIFDKITDAMNPKFEDEKPINPFDLWEGANFKLKIREVEGYRNYDKSEFDAPSQLADDDKLEEIWKSEYSLQDFLDPKNFKSYDDLKARLNKVLGLNQTKAAVIDEPSEDIVDRKSKASPVSETKKVDTSPWDDNEEDADLALFRSMMADDD